ncbi:MAG TPA: Maf family protein [Ilumatobacteraceae bacterium]|nr:Maf family protein [Ilumatobacteraceae bacterium]
MLVDLPLVDLRGRRLVLASASPRRAELLRSVGLSFDVVPADIDESARPDEEPATYVARLSAEKARTVAERVGRDALVVAADTTVDVDGRILEKPHDDFDARRMLRLLSGRTHLVHTGVTTLSVGVGSGRAGSSVSVVVETAVRFVELTDRAIDWYLSTGEHEGKAGGYGIQGAAGAFVDRVEGSVTNVIGLPLAETLELLGTPS